MIDGRVVVIDKATGNRVTWSKASSHGEEQVIRDCCEHILGQEEVQKLEFDIRFKKPDLKQSKSLSQKSAGIKLVAPLKRADTVPLSNLVAVETSPQPRVAAFRKYLGDLVDIFPQQSPKWKDSTAHVDSPRSDGSVDLTYDYSTRSYPSPLKHSPPRAPTGVQIYNRFGTACDDQKWSDGFED